MTRETRFGRTRNVGQALRDRTRRPGIAPTGGFDGGQRPTELPPGRSPEMKNFELDDGRLLPRSGLSQYEGGNSGLSAPVLGGLEAFEEEGVAIGVIASHRTFAISQPQDPDWEVLAGDGQLSGATTDFWETTTIYDDDRGTHIAVFTNNDDLPRYVDLETNVQSVSSFTNVSSQFSEAQAVAAFDDRLVWGNVREASANDRRSSRVFWSQRGKPQSYDNLGTQAGFDDLFDMNGRILKMVRFQNRLWIFSDQEIWSARPRRDVFAFNFEAHIRQIGAPLPRTIRATSEGIFFLTDSLEVYRMGGGGRVEAVGPAEQGGDSRIQKKLQEEIQESDLTWAAYDRIDQSYKVFYSATAGSWPDKSLTYDLETRAFTFHEYPVELTHGFEFRDPVDTGLRGTWDGQMSTWDESDEEWNEVNIQPLAVQDRSMGVFSSTGTSYRFRDDQTTDDGTAIDARWRSRPLRATGSPDRSYLDRIEMEYEADSASSLTVAVSDDGFASDFDKQIVSVRSSKLSNANVPVRISGRAPQFEIRTDGDGPEISRFWPTLRSAGRF